MQKIKSGKQHGFTLIELMIAIAIIGILAAVAIPNFIQYRQRGYNTAANADVKNAYMAAQNFFVDNPADDVELSTDDLAEFGFTGSDGVTLTIVNGALADLSITTVHNAGTLTYTVDSAGGITSAAN